jgi:hypothetical protein
LLRPKIFFLLPHASFAIFGNLPFLVCDIHPFCLSFCLSLSLSLYIYIYRETHITPWMSVNERSAWFQGTLFCQFQFIVTHVAKWVLFLSKNTTHNHVCTIQSFFQRCRPRTSINFPSFLPTSSVFFPFSFLRNYFFVWPKW